MVVSDDDDEQMEESAPVESVAPKKPADVPESAEADGEADGDKADEEGGEEAEGEEAGEEGAKAGPSGAARPLKLKQASKAKGAPPKGSTAATIQYHKYDVAGAATWKVGAACWKGAACRVGRATARHPLPPWRLAL